IWEGLRGPNATVVSGACSSLDAFALAATHLEQARAEAFVVAGTEALSEQSYLACARLGLLAKATKGAAPSFVLGEGAAAFCLEPLARARARQAAVQAQLVGYASGFAAPADSAQLLQVDAATLSSVMRQALEDAAVAPADIDVVCGAQSGLAPYDQAELRAVHEVFGAEVCLAAPKHWFGESFGAAGALGVAAVLAWLAGAPVAPLWPARPPPQQAVRAVLVLDVGHYGNASALVLRLDDPTANPSRS
ncbi:MAG: beta-ketoacyl synthase N-terminal-like domain-containing protein, partial [Polyangiales bacterium]